jgi:hypothetical protein
MYIPLLNQILLFLVVVILTTLLTLSGIQVYHILKDLRITVKKINNILEDTNTISSSIAKPIMGISGFISGIKSGSDIINLFLRPKEEKK